MEEKKLLKKKAKFFEERNLNSYADACNSLGAYYHSIEQYEKALNEYKEESRVYKNMGKRIENAKAHRMIGEMYLLLENMPKALEHEKIYLKIAKEENNLVEQQRAYATIGRAFLIEGQTIPDSANKSLKQAEKSFMKSLLICKDLKEIVGNSEIMDMQARLYLNLSVTKENMNSVDESVKYMERAIGICQSNSFSELLHKCYIDFGIMMNSKCDDTSRALKYLNLALNTAESLTNRAQKICETLLLKAQILIKLGDWQSAKQVLHKGYKLKTPEETDNEEIKRLLKIVTAMCYTEESLIMVDAFDYEAKKRYYEKMGDGSCQLKNFSKGIDYYLKMLENAELNGETGTALIPIYVSLAQTYRDNEQNDLAVDYLWKEYNLEYDNPKEAYTTLLSIYEIYGLQSKSFWDREKILMQARSDIRRTGDPKLDKFIIGKLLMLYKAEKMEFLGENLIKEAELEGIDVKSIDLNDATDDNELTDCEENTPDIGADICLDDLSDSSNNDEDIQPVRQIRKRRPNLKMTKNMKGETQLHLACISGNVILVERLLDQNHPTNCRDNAGWLPLHEAANLGHIDVVRLLLQKGGTSQINDRGGTECDGITPLYDACRNGNLEIVNLLLDHNANSTILTDMGETPLDGLVKWRSKVKLTEMEAAEYENTRTRLTTSLNSAGIQVSNKSIEKQCSENITMNMSRRNVSKSRSLSSSFNELHRGGIILNESPCKSIISDHLSDDEIVGSSGVNTNAAMEYQKVMSSLRHNNKNSVPEEIPSTFKRRISDPTTKRGAYLNENEIDVVDNWLENDVENSPLKKKTKYFTDRSFGDVSTPKITPPRYKINDENTNSYEIFQMRTTRGESNESTQSNTSKLSKRNSLISLSNRSSSSKKRQTKLIDSGFSRGESSSPLTVNYHMDINKSLDNIETDNFMIVSPKQDAVCTVITNNVTKKMMHVECLEHTFMITVEAAKKDELTMKWLAKEVAERYYHVEGIRPTVTLTTPEGGLIDIDETISIILDTNMKLKCQILDWEISPLSARYMDICKQEGIVADPHFCKIFEHATIWQTVNLSNQGLTSTYAQIVFKALKHESNLTVLDLSNNDIGNIGVELLTKILSKLPSLEKLNLGGNFITMSGLRSIDKLLKENMNCLQHLTELNLEYNRFGDNGVPYLISILNKLQGLQKLSLNGCDLTDLTNYNLNLQNLTTLDISNNKNLKMYSIKKILTKFLNPTKITSINFSGSLPQGYLNFGLDLGTFFSIDILEGSDPRLLTDISLIQCQLTDDDLKIIIDALNQYSCVETLKLSKNKFTMQGFQLFFDCKFTIKQLFLNGCNDLLRGSSVAEFLEQEKCEGIKYPQQIHLSISMEENLRKVEMETLQSIWDKYWGMLGRIFVRKDNVKLYVENSGSYF